MQKCENWLRFDKVTDSLKVGTFLRYSVDAHIGGTGKVAEFGLIHVLGNILHSRYVARTPPLEAPSPGRRGNVENAPRRRPVTGQPAMPTYGAQC